MRTTHLRRLAGAGAALLLPAVVVAGPATAQPDHAKQRGQAVAPAAAADGTEGGPKNVHKRDSYPVTGDYTDTWTRTDAREIELTDENTLPLWDELPVENVTDDVWIWDSWPLTNLDTRTVSYKGWRVLFSLTADRDLAFPQRHWTAEIGYSISRDGKSWDYQGDLFPENVNPPGAREWAGSAILRGNRVYVYYTASGEEGAADDEPEYFRQKLAMASAKISAGRNGIRFSDWSEHKILASADGELYQTLEQSLAGPIIYGFRDPWVFRNPETGGIQMLFEGNTPGETVECLPRNIGPGDTPPIDEQAKFYNGNIGLAASTGGMDSFKLLPPIMNANCMNQQLERPHAVFRGGLVYLYTISHKFTFAPNLQGNGVDGLFGFVGPSIRSDYTPLNDSGLVLANPPQNNTQAYSWYAMPGGFVTSFIDNVEGEYWGTLAPTVKITTKSQDRTAISHIFDTPFIP